MPFHCIKAKSYFDDPTTDWHEAESWCNDEDDAARWFMESVEDVYGSFGIDDNAQPIHVLVFDSDSNQTYLVSVSSNPQPAYSNTTLDESDREYEYGDAWGVGPRPKL